MRLFFKTELDLNFLAEKTRSCFCANQTSVSEFEEVSGGIFISFLIPPDIGRLILHQNSGPFLASEMAAWSYYIQAENLPALTEEQEEIAWTQMKMSGAFLRASKTAAEVLAVKSHFAATE